ncbi:MLX-interacting protein-like [Ornithodoros turicata]|uniref:MLX-interacting protein-like n=1 Tax=Ornithodoros turicata TaxID=34597 RepID=UPI003138EF37
MIGNMEMNCLAMSIDKEDVLRTAKKSTTEIIHSGHFMVSDIEDTDVTDDPPRAREDDCVEEVEQSLMEPVNEENEEMTFGDVSMEHEQNSKPTNHITIDASLTKLFECMTLAYSGKLTSPKWKTFKGLKLKLKDKIRLNNIIWRAWHMQFVIKRRPHVCQFASPLEGDTHNKPEAIVMEGKYWKRKVTNITAEYKKWRMYFCKNGSSKTGEDTVSYPMDLDFRWFSQSEPIDDGFIMDLSDTLFSSLSQPFDFPNPREIAVRAGLADFIQPGLIQLQPAFEDFMDTFEPLSDVLNSKLPTLAEEGAVGADTGGVSQMDEFQLPQQQRQPPPLLYARQPSVQDQFQQLQEQQQQQQQQRQLQQNVYNNTLQVQPHMNASDPYATSVAQQNAHQVQCVPHTQQQQLPSPTEQTIRNYGFVPNQNTSSSFAVRSQMTQVSPQMAPQIVPRQRSAFQPSQSYPKKVERPPVAPKQATSFGNLVLQGNSSAADPQRIFQPAVVAGFADKEKPLGVDHSLRRHSYTGSHADSSYGAQSSHTGAYAGQGAVNGGGKGVNFAVPKVASKGRIRARSMSSPQSNSKLHAAAGAVVASAKQAGSVGNLPRVHSPPQLLIPKPLSPMSTGRATTSSNSVSPPAQPSTVLTQLLTTSGNAFSWDAQTAQATTGISRGSSPATVTILSTVAGPVAAAQPQTFVFTPVTLSAIPSTNNIQRGLIVATPPPAPSTTLAHPTKQGNSTPANNLSQAKTSETTPSAATAKPFRPKSDEERVQYREKRRVCHINAEQKRRFNIKNGFESLRHLLPSLSQNPDSKVSKAQMLQQAGEYIRTLKTERQKQQDEAEELRKQIEKYSQEISSFQSQLPATGVPLAYQRTNHLRDNFEEYVRARTLQNWKFWIFSLLLEPLLESYNQTVSKACLDEMCKTVLKWVEQNCSLRDLRPGVLTSLTYLSTSTNILTDPGRLPEEAKQAVAKRDSASRYKKLPSESHKDR